MRFRGLFTAIVTPFDERGRVDEEGLRENLEFQMKHRVEGVIPTGTTGESATLTPEEHRRVIELTVETIGGKCEVIAGTGSNSTEEALDYTKYAEEVGADAALLITPYYNKPSQEGLYRHYAKVAEETDLPLILYNVPSRTAVDLLPETVERLALEYSNIVGVKEASGNLDYVSKLVASCGRDFCVLSGNDSLSYPIITLGGCGAVSVASNIVPGMVKELTDAALEGKLEKARELHYRLFPLFKALFLETNPIPVKAAMELLGLKAGKPRLPLLEANEATKRALREVLRELGLLG